MKSDLVHVEQRWALTIVQPTNFIKRDVSIHAERVGVCKGCGKGLTILQAAE
jgi:hypothetical protein